MGMTTYYNVQRQYDLRTTRQQGSAGGGEVAPVRVEGKIEPYVELVNMPIPVMWGTPEAFDLLFRPIPSYPPNTGF